MRIPALLVLTLGPLTLASCGGLVETSDAPGEATNTKTAPSALTVSGLWIARAPLEEARFNVLALCEDGTISHDLPSRALGVVPACPSPTGIYRVDADSIAIADGSSRMRATLQDDTLVMAAEGARYFRAAAAEELDGTYMMRNIIGDQGDVQVTMTRKLRFDGDHYRFDNELAGRSAADRWSTVEEGTFAIPSPGLVDLVTGGIVRRAHVVRFGPGNQYLHVEDVGYLVRAPQ